MERLDDGTVRYLLSEFDFTDADKGALGRRAYGRSAGLTEYAAEARARDSELEKFLTEQVGTRAEQVGAEHLKLPFNASVGNTRNVDLADLIEIRGRRGAGTDLPIRPRDKMRLPHLLIRFYGKYAHIIGWLCGWEGQKRARELNLKLCPIRHVWYVPPPYHSVLSLEQWLMCGHRLHWMPPLQKYARLLATNVCS
jgi:hypothetical protein